MPPHFDTIYSTIFDQKYMRDLFGEDSKSPDIGERTRVFFELWQQWEHRSVRIKSYRNKDVRNILLALGYKEHFEFQLRNGELRCDSDEMLAMAMINGLENMRKA